VTPRYSAQLSPVELNGTCVVFDLDGTLVDTALDLAAALNHVLVAAGRRPVEPPTVRMLVGHGARVLLQHGFAETGDPLAPDAVGNYVAQFLAFYANNIARESSPFPGVREALVRLSEAGARLGVCTNKPEALSRSLLRALDLDCHFGAILGADSLAFKKPDPRHFLETVNGLGGNPARSVFIGDSPVDVATARAAQVPIIAVTFGYTPVPPEELGADALIGSFDELDDALARLLGGTQ
jgi:phosphoglycolate phosphatase